MGKTDQTFWGQKTNQQAFHDLCYTQNKWTDQQDLSELNTNIKEHMKHLPKGKKDLKDQVTLNIYKAQTMSSPD